VEQSWKRLKKWLENSIKAVIRIYSESY